MLGLDLTLVQAPRLPLNVKLLLTNPELGFAFASTPEMLPVQVVLGLVKCSEIPLIVILAEVPDVPVTVTGHVVVERLVVIAVHAALPLNVAPVTAALPLVSVSVKVALQGTGLPTGEAVVGPAMLAVPLVDQLPPL